LIDKICGEGELNETLDVEKDFEPRLVRLVGEEGIAGGRDVPGAEGDEEVEGGRGGLVELLRIEGDEINS
jgi:hypothetical protein